MSRIVRRRCGGMALGLYVGLSFFFRRRRMSIWSIVHTGIDVCDGTFCSGEGRVRVGLGLDVAVGVQLLPNGEHPVDIS
jgi:hypothetical protein